MNLGWAKYVHLNGRMANERWAPHGRDMGTIKARNGQFCIFATSAYELGPGAEVADNLSAVF